MEKLNREPVAIWNALVAPLLMAAAMLLPFNENGVGVIQAIILAVTGLVATTGIRTDGFFVALSGLAKALVAAFLTFGVPISEPVQTFILTAITIVGAFVVERPQVEAKVMPLARSAAPEWGDRAA